MTHKVSVTNTGDNAAIPQPGAALAEAAIEDYRSGREQAIQDILDEISCRDCSRPIAGIPTGKHLGES